MSCVAAGGSVASSACHADLSGCQLHVQVKSLLEAKADPLLTKGGETALARAVVSSVCAPAEFEPRVKSRSLVVGLPHL